MKFTLMSSEKQIHINPTSAAVRIGMNFVVKNKAPVWRPSANARAQTDSGARQWLAQFPNHRKGAQSQNGTTSSTTSVRNHASNASGQSNSFRSLLFDAPPTTGSNSLASDNRNATTTLIVAAVSVGRGHASTEVGLACMDAHSPVLTLSQFSDDMCFGGLTAALNLYAVDVVLLPNTLFDQQPTAPVLAVLRATFPHMRLAAVDRSRFNNQRGTVQLLQLCLRRAAEQVEVNLRQYYAITACAALLEHMQTTVVRAPFAEHSLAVRFVRLAGSMHVDVESAHRLELLYALYPSGGGGGGQRRTSLYGVLNACVTHIGQRAMRARILQPSCDVERIAEMHACVEEFRGAKEPLLAELRRLLGRDFRTVDRLIRIAYRLPQVREDNFRTAEVLIKQALQLRACVDAVPDLFAVLSELEAPGLVEMRAALQDERLPVLSTKIFAVLGADATMAVDEATAAAAGGKEGGVLYGGGVQFNQRLHAVRRGVNGMLDLNRTIYAALMGDIQREVERLRQAHGVPLRLLYSKSRSFHVQLPVRKSTTTVERMLQDLQVVSSITLQSSTTIQINKSSGQNIHSFIAAAAASFSPTRR